MKRPGDRYFVRQIEGFGQYFLADYMFVSKTGRRSMDIDITTCAKAEDAAEFDYSTAQKIEKKLPRGWHVIPKEKVIG